MTSVATYLLNFAVIRAVVNNIFVPKVAVRLLLENLTVGKTDFFTSAFLEL
jgi:hypothetical protein